MIAVFVTFISRFCQICCRSETFEWNLPTLLHPFSVFFAGSYKCSCRFFKRVNLVSKSIRLRFNDSKKCIPVRPSWKQASKQVEETKCTYVVLNVVYSRYWMVNRIFPDPDCNRWRPSRLDTVFRSYRHHCNRSGKKIVRP